MICLSTRPRTHLGRVLGRNIASRSVNQGRLQTNYEAIPRCLLDLDPVGCPTASVGLEGRRFSSKWGEAVTRTSCLPRTQLRTFWTASPSAAG